MDEPVKNSLIKWDGADAKLQRFSDHHSRLELALTSPDDKKAAVLLLEGVVKISSVTAWSACKLRAERIDDYTDSFTHKSVSLLRIYDTHANSEFFCLSAALNQSR